VCPLKSGNSDPDDSLLWGVRFDATSAAHEPVELRVRLLRFLFSSRFAWLRHEEILKRAGIPVTPGLMGYRYVAEGELEELDPGATVRRVY
jgi:hypothetical protein